jgi:hypothetical protein
MTTPPAPAVIDGDLRQVRTAADATAWLDRRAAELLAEAEAEPAPDHARGLRLAGTTLQAVAFVGREWRDDVTAADALTRLACSYPAMTTDELRRTARYHQLACEHVANALRQLYAQLTYATGTERTRHGSVEASRRPVALGRDL